MLALPQHKSKNPRLSHKPQRSLRHPARRCSVIRKSSNPSASFGLSQTIAPLVPTHSFLPWPSRISFGSPRKTALTIPRLFLRGHSPVLPRRKIRLANSVKGPGALPGIIGTPSPIKPSETTSPNPPFHRSPPSIPVPTRSPTQRSFPSPTPLHHTPSLR